MREAHLQGLPLKFLTSTFRMEISVLSECHQEPPEAIGRVVVAPRLKLRGASSGFSLEGVAEVWNKGPGPGSWGWGSGPAFKGPGHCSEDRFGEI